MNYSHKIWPVINSWVLFLIVLAGLAGWHLWQVKGATVGDMSSDVWLVQYYMIQEKEGAPWEFLPPSYNKERFYLAYPLLYYLNPGLEHGLVAYKLGSLAIILAAYLVTGLVVRRLTRSWFLAAVAGALFVIPHTIFPTHVGMISFRNWRGLALVFPLYALLSYYWVVYGIHQRWQNIVLALAAAFSVYLYPPFGVVIVPLLVVSALLLYRASKWRLILLFVVLYLLGSSLFWYGHFTNPASGMLDIESKLGAEEMGLQAEILRYRMPDVSLAGMDFGVIKRSVWDGLPLLAMLILSLLFYKRVRQSFSESQWRAYRFGLWFTLVLGAFIFAVEGMNWFLALYGHPPFFIEHWRLMRMMGFVWIIHALLVLYYLGWKRNHRLATAIILVILIASPLAISTPLVRAVVRRVVPEEIRVRYNLAPIVPLADRRSFLNLQAAAYWARRHLEAPGAKVFAFNEDQEDFKFKVLSRLETNLTVKEGSMWITSGSANSQKWYNERKHYDEVVKSAQDFDSVMKFARELDSTHLLLPRGKWSELYEETSPPLKEVFANPDYRILSL